ncbi:CHAT domain-containing protein [[Phormidium] sp. ETS-05]|uniref:CHAT domain-containing protein n=1 Tax=[Phormidium] sp. ETS-05 TaxID=222819 RepID=UPI0018EF1004|nr:CHAT domain-containing tetratricopeptide repeat protein [[Phormidium] sp. ETS-05]
MRHQRFAIYHPEALCLGLMLTMSSLVATDIASASAVPRAKIGVIAENCSTPEADRWFEEGRKLVDAAAEESLRSAIQKFEAAVRCYRRLGSIDRVAIGLNKIGYIYNRLGEKQRALSYYRQALPLFRQLGDKSREAGTLHGMGWAYSDLGDQETALDYLNQALVLRKELRDKKGEARTLSGIARAYSDLGDKQKALSYYNQALLLSQEVGDKDGEAATLHGMGWVYLELGEKQTALDLFNRALKLRRELGDKRREAETLNIIGQVYSSLGDSQTALSYFSQSLPVRRQMGDKRGEAITLSDMGRVHFDLNLYRIALIYFDQSLILFRQVGDKKAEARTLTSLGVAYYNLGDKQTALNYYNQALSLSRQVRDKRGEAATILWIGEIYFSLRDPKTALSYFNQSLPLFQEVGDKEGESANLYSLARVFRRQGKLDAARQNIEAAITIIENLRTKIASEKLRQFYFAKNQDSYEFYIDLLMQLHQQQPDKGYDAKALNASERARARTLIEILAEAHVDIRFGVDASLVERERTLQQQLDEVKKRLIELSSVNNNRDEVVELTRKQDSLLAQYENVQAEIRSASPRYAAIAQPQPLTLEEIQQQVLDENTIILEYSLGEERSYLWLVSKSGITSYELPPRAKIEKVARYFLHVLIRPDDRNILSLVADAGKALSQIILQPVAEQLGNKRLVVVADGTLQYIPFAALTIPGKDVPLIVEHEIINLPSASTIAILRRETAGRKPAPKTLAILADPVFNPKDKRIDAIPQTTRAQNEGYLSNLFWKMLLFERSASLTGMDWQRLPFTRQEAQAIIAMVPAEERISFFDFQADRAHAISPELSQYRIVHFATHGFADSKKPELSGIVLSLVDEAGSWQNGYLHLYDIFSLNLPAELVVLSACQTGIGHQIKGEGIVGLTRGFMYAGALRVAVSLWSVDDQATAILMSSFYEKMLSEGMPPAQALRATQLEMWHSFQWKAPYYWAAFTLQGEWQ